MPKYLSGRSKKNPDDKLSLDRYKYLSLGDAESNPGNPQSSGISVGQKGSVVGGFAPPTGSTGYNLVTYYDDDRGLGTRYWEPVGGGLIPASSTVRDEGVEIGTAKSITTFNFVGSAITAIASDYVPGGTSGFIATMTVAPPGEVGSVLFKENIEWKAGHYRDDFNTSPNLIFNSSVGILTVGQGINIGTAIAGVGGSIFNVTGVGNSTIVGIGTTTALYNLHVIGDIGISSGTIYDVNNYGGSDGDIIIKNDDGYIEWKPRTQVITSAGGTIGNIQFHDSAGFVEGASDWNGSSQNASNSFVWDYTNHRVGLGSTEPSSKFDVIGDSKFTGVSTFVGLTSVIDGGFFADDVYVSAASTFVGFSTFSDSVYIAGIATIGNIEIGITDAGNKIYNNNGVLLLEAQGSFVQVEDQLYVNNTTESTNTTSGALQVTGGAGIAKNVNVGGALSITGPADATGVAVTLAAAGGITTTGGDLYIGGDLFVSDDIVLDEARVQNLIVNPGVSTFHGEIHALSNVGIGTTAPTRELTIYSPDSGSTYINLTNATTGTTTSDGFGIGLSGDEDAKLWNYENTNMIFGTNSEERLRITSGGVVNIGDNFTQTTYPFSVQKNMDAGGNLAYFANSDGDYNQGLTLSFDTSKDVKWAGGSATGGLIWNMGTNGYVWQIGSSEKLRIDNGGRVLINSTSAINTENIVEVHNTIGAKIGIARSDTVTVANNIIGAFNFYGNDANGTFEEVAKIEVNADSNHDTGTKPGRIVFSTTPDGASSAVERLRIDSSGNVGIGTDNPDVLLHAEGSGSTGITFEGSSSNTNPISGDAGTYLILKNKSATDGNFSNILGTDAGGQATSQISFISKTQSTNAGELAFATRVASGNMAERLRITSEGNVGIGTDDPDKLLTVGIGSTAAYSSDASNTPNLNTLLTLTNKSGTDGIGTGYYSAMRFSIADGATSSGWLSFIRTADNKGDFTFKARNAASSYPELMRIKSTGKVGIGVTSPTRTLTIQSNGGQLAINDTDNTQGEFFVNAGNLSAYCRGNSNLGDGSTGGYFTVHTHPAGGSITERLRIASDGQLQVSAANTISHYSVSNYDGTMTVLDTTEPSVEGVGGRIVFGSKYWTGSNTMSGAYIGQYKEYAPDNGADEYKHALTFGTRSDSNTMSEKLRITSEGYVQIPYGTAPGSSPTTGKAPLYIGVTGKSSISYTGGNADTACVRIEDEGGNNNYYHGIELRTKNAGDVRIYAHDQGSNNAADLVIATDKDETDDANEIIEKMRIQSGGNVGINSSDPQAKLDVVVSSANRTWEVADNTVAKFERNGLNRIAIVGGTNAKCQIDFGDTEEINPGFIRYDHANDSMTFRTDGGMRLRITSAGDVGIGTTNPTSTNIKTELESNNTVLAVGIVTANKIYGATIEGDLTPSGSVTIENNLTVKGDTTLGDDLSSDTITVKGNLNINSSYIDFSGDVSTPATAAAIFRPADNTLAFSTANVEKLRITSGGKVLIGTTSDVAPDSFGSNLQIDSGAAAGSISLGRHTDSASGPILIFHKSRSGSGAGIATVQNGDALGGFRFYGADGTDRNSYGANITCEVDGLVGVNSMPGRLIFQTTPSDSSTAIERLRIDSDGNIGFGNFSSGTSLTYPLHLKNAMGSSPSWIHMEVTGTNTVGGGGGIAFDTSASSDASDNSLYLATIAGIRNSDNNGSNDLVFSTSKNGVGANLPVEKLRITSDGKVGIGTTNPDELLHTYSSTTPLFLLESESYKSYIGTIETADNLNNGSAAGELALRGQSGISFSANNATTTQLRIASDGIVTLKGTDTTDALDLEINTSSNASTLVLGRNGNITSNIRASDGNSNIGDDNNAGGSRLRLGKNQIHFDTYPAAATLGYTPVFTERLTIDTSGVVRVGNTATQTTSSNTKRIALGERGSIWGWTSGTIDGSLNLADNYYWDGAYNKAIVSADAAYLALRSGTLRFGTTDGTTPTAGDNIGLTEKFRITNDGYVGINTTDPRFNQEAATSGIKVNSTRLGVKGSICIGNLSTVSTDKSELAFYRRGGGAAGSPIDGHKMGRIAWYGSSNDTALPDKAWSIEVTPDGGGWTDAKNRKGYLSFVGYASTEALRITSGGRVLAGNYFTSKQVGDLTAAFQIQGTDSDTSSMSLFRYSANDSGPTITLGKGRGAAGGVEKPNDGDALGTIRFMMANNNDLLNGYAARIDCNVDAAPGGGDTPGRLTFWTSPDGSSTPKERLRINSSGDVGIGTDTINAPLTVVNNDNAGYIASFRQKHASNSAQIIIDSPADNNIRPASIDLANAGTIKWSLGQAYDSSSSGAFHIATSALSTNDDGAKLTITTTGKVGIGTHNPRAKFDVRPGGHSGDGAVTFTTGLGEVGATNNAIQSINGTGASLQPLGYRATEHIFATQNKERLRITHEGYVGIGTTNPTKAISLDNNNTGITTLAVAGIVTAHEMYASKFHGEMEGSVTSVGSVTGSVGSVTGNVGGTVGSGSGDVVLGNVDGNVTGNVDGNIGGSVGAGGDVTAVDGNVNGNVNGNVTGSVGSVTGTIGDGTGANVILGNIQGNITGSVANVTGDITGNATTASDLASGETTNFPRIVYQSGQNTTAFLPKGSNGEFLRLDGSGNLDWETPSGISDVVVKQYADNLQPTRTERGGKDPITVTNNNTIGIGSTSNAYGHKYVQTDEPTGGDVKEGDLWYDTSEVGSSGLLEELISTTSMNNLQQITITGLDFTTYPRGYKFIAYNFNVHNGSNDWVAAKLRMQLGTSAGIMDDSTSGQYQWHKTCAISYQASLDVTQQSAITYVELTNGDAWRFFSTEVHIYPSNLSGTPANGTGTGDGGYPTMYSIKTRSLTLYAGSYYTQTDSVEGGMKLENLPTPVSNVDRIKFFTDTGYTWNGGSMRTYGLRF